MQQRTSLFCGNTDRKKKLYGRQENASSMQLFCTKGFWNAKEERV